MSARRGSAIDDVRPFLGLAREIHHEVQRVAAEGASADALEEAVAAIPRRERLNVAKAVFDRLPPDQQWSIIERFFDDDEIRTALEAERDRRAAIARVGGAKRLDTREIPIDEELVLGLATQADVRVAVQRGSATTMTARRLVLRRISEDASFRVIEDVFNPAGGYFVTSDYDKDTWRDCDRLPSHGVVRVGSITSGTEPSSFEPVLYLAGRVDTELDGTLVPGRLHLAYAMVGGADLFVGPS